MVDFGHYFIGSDYYRLLGMEQGNLFVFEITRCSYDPNFVEMRTLLHAIYLRAEYLNIPRDYELIWIGKHKHHAKAIYLKKDHGMEACREEYLSLY